ncbi:MAG: FeoC-like transcriptional regulator [Acidobacteriota bacterium]
MGVREHSLAASSLHSGGDRCVSPGSTLVLTQLLNLLKKGGLHTEGDLAEAMGVSRELVAAMLADLERRGLLAPSPEGCTSACSRCPLQKGCQGLAQEVKVFQVGPLMRDGKSAPAPDNR